MDFLNSIGLTVSQDAGCGECDVRTIFPLYDFIISLAIYTSTEV